MTVGIDISVIIPTHNRAHLLQQCLDSLCAQDLDARRFEVIVVDDASTDQTADVWRLPRERVRVRGLRLPANVGQAAAKNAGAAMAAGRILLFMDDDMRAIPGCLASHLHAHTGEPRVVFGPIEAQSDRNAGAASGFLAASLQAKFRRLALDSTPLWPIDASVMPNSSMPRTLFIEHGAFDAQQFPRRREDEEFGLRLWKSGVPFTFAPDALAAHRWDKPPSHVEADWIEAGAALVRLYAKHPELAGTQAVFGRLLRLPSWKRRLAFALAGHTRLLSAFMSACGIRDRDKITRAMCALHGAMAEAKGRREFMRIFSANAAGRS